MPKFDIYLDNAATTKLDHQVLEEMYCYLKDVYGNPSSIHKYGRESRTLIEKSRRKVADILQVSPAEIFFTSGGTESDNTIIFDTIIGKGIKQIITSPIEHHAVLHTIEYIQKKGWASVEYVKLDTKGGVDLENLEFLCKQYPNSLVSLMHANNEIGNIICLEQIAKICKSYGCIFHSDTVQTIGQVPINLAKDSPDFIVGSAHKFHGPKGVGFLYAKNPIGQYIHGGAQERNVRGGTENLHGIIGLAKALEIATYNLAEQSNHIKLLKKRMIEGLEKEIIGLVFNGYSNDFDKSLDKILSITLPNCQSSDLVLFQLDIEGVFVSGGSACTSGSLIGSHVLNELNPGSENTVIRFSFSKYNSIEDVQNAISVLKKCLENI